MRQILVAGLLIISLVAIAPPSFARTRVHAPAVTADSAQDRYCISGDSWGYNCEFLDLRAVSGDRVGHKRRL
jgi:hypothetical protein